MVLIGPFIHNNNNIIKESCERKKTRVGEGRSLELYLVGPRVGLYLFYNIIFSKYKCMLNLLCYVYIYNYDNKTFACELLYYNKLVNY